MIIIGHIISITVTIVAVFWAINKMFILQSSGSLIIVITLLATTLGATINLLLLRPMFQSLDRLKQQAQSIAQNDFRTTHDITFPSEFMELSEDFNAMSTTLEKTFQSLKNSEHEKDKMIAQLSHDIKTPITSIRSTVEGILDGVITADETEEYLQTIDRQTDRLNNLVEELGYVSSNAMNQPLLVATDFFIDQVLVDTMSEFQLQIDREKRKVAITIDPPTAQIRSDRDKVSRILFNLINNALKYSKAGTQLGVHATLANKKLTIAVTDQGIGIQPDQQKDVFKRLYRAESSRNLNTGGHGLGLYIARELAHQLQGDIRLESTFGQGSTFFVELPLTLASDKDHGNKKSSR